MTGFLKRVDARVAQAQFAQTGVGDQQARLAQQPACQRGDTLGGPVFEYDGFCGVEYKRVHMPAPLP